MAREPIPVYMICGFLDAGKTNFIAPMLTGEEFTEDERTLLLVCEEGEEEYDTEALGKHNVVPIFLEGKEDLTLSRMEALEAEYRPHPNRGGIQRHVANCRGRPRLPPALGPVSDRHHCGIPHL